MEPNLNIQFYQIQNTGRQWNVSKAFFFFKFNKFIIIKIIEFYSDQREKLKVRTARRVAAVEFLVKDDKDVNAAM